MISEIDAALDRAGLAGARRAVCAACCDQFPRRDPAEVIAAAVKLLGRRDLSDVRYPSAYARTMAPDLSRALTELVEW